MEQLSVHKKADDIIYYGSIVQIIKVYLFGVYGCMKLLSIAEI